MFLGRCWRKKRKVLLQTVPTPAKKPAMSAWLPPIDNVTQRERSWFNSFFQSHRAFCGCNDPIYHLSTLAARFNMQSGPSPGGDPRLPQPPLRRLPALPAPQNSPNNSNRRSWPGGDGGAAGGPEGDGGAGGPAAADDYQQEDLDELFAAIEGEE